MKAYQHIWEIVSKIPRGKVATYGQIAKLAGLKHGARMVGYALHQLPKHSTTPWHRVINAKGCISFPKDTPPYNEQMSRLIAEGILMKNGNIDLKKYGWESNLDELIWGEPFK